MSHPPTTPKKRKIRREATPRAILRALQRIDPRVADHCFSFVKTICDENREVEDAYRISQVEHSIVALAKQYVAEVAQISQRHLVILERLGIEVAKPDEDIFSIIDHNVRLAAADLDTHAVLKAAVDRARVCPCCYREKSIWTKWDLEMKAFAAARKTRRTNSESSSLQ